MQAKSRARRAIVIAAALAAPLASAQEACDACHGAGGNSTSPGIPSIAAQPRLFLENQLVLMREGIRPAPVMQGLVSGMKDAEITRLATHYSKQPAKIVTTGARNEAVARQGRESAQALRCGVCHLADYRGQNQVPRLAAQREDYLVASMREYRDQQRKGGDTIMAAALYGVSDGDIAALAHYLARLR
jgi:cytochrome c553